MLSFSSPMFSCFSREHNVHPGRTKPGLPSAHLRLIMNMDLATLVVTPDGRSYGYTWHRANSDLYLVAGWA